jgi:hypothetical protein
MWSWKNERGSQSRNEKLPLWPGTNPAGTSIAEVVKEVQAEPRPWTSFTRIAVVFTAVAVRR